MARPKLSHMLLPKTQSSSSVVALNDDATLLVDDLAWVAPSYEAAVGGDGAAAARLAKECAVDARRLLLVRLRCRRAAGGLGACVTAARRAPTPELLRLIAALCGDASGARSMSRRGACTLAARLVEARGDEDDVAGAAAEILDAAGDGCAFQTRDDESDDDEGVGRYDLAGGAVLLRCTVGERQKAHFDVGFATWPAAAVLAARLAREPVDAAGEDVAELGAGTGLAGLVFAAVARPRRLVLTDYNDVVLANLRFNAALNAAVLERTDVAVAKLDFSEATAGDDETYDRVVAADCVASERDAQNLARTIAERLRRGGEALVCLAAPESRFGTQHFAPAARRAGLAVATETAVPDAEDTPLLAGSSGWTPGMAFEFHRVSWP